MRNIILKVIRLIEKILLIFFLFGLFGSIKEFSDLNFWIAIICLAFVMFTPLELLYKLVSKKSSKQTTDNEIALSTSLETIDSSAKHEEYATQVNSIPDSNESLNQLETALAPSTEANAAYQKVPQEVLNSMRISYTDQQAANDMRIIDESLAVMQKTSDIDSFLSRYDTVMRRVLTLEQAKRAGIPITLQDGFSQSLVKIKEKELAGVLYRSFQKELDEISKLKTERGQLSRLEKYQEKLKGMYEDVFEFVAEDAYNDVMQKIELIKSNQ